MKGKIFIVLVFLAKTFFLANVHSFNVTDNFDTSRDETSRDEVPSHTGLFIPNNQNNLVVPDQSKLTLTQWTEWHHGPCYSGIIAHPSMTSRKIKGLNCHKSLNHLHPLLVRRITDPIGQGKSLKQLKLGLP